MSLLVVENPGLLTTVQDLGREGFGPLGVSASGAADPVALRLGNLLVGNEPGAAALEMTLIGGSFTFPGGAAVALAGADFISTLNGRPLEVWVAHAVHPGGNLTLGPTRAGARCYLCIAGGVQVEPFLGSASTHLLSGLGGFAGRELHKGDVLRIGTPKEKLWRRRISTRVLQALKPGKVLRVTDGPQTDWFDEEAKRAFYRSTFRVSEESNRMGLRLEGAPVKTVRAEEMISEGVSLGAIQVAPSGQPIILFVEQQTTGGYPKIANVISADMHSVGQLRPRDEIRFERVSLEEARALLIAQQAILNSREKIFA
jgi:antagonist of KipI